MPSDYATTMANTRHPSEKKQKNTARADYKNLTAKHMEILQIILTLVDTQTIDLLRPESLIKEDQRNAYAMLPDEKRRTVDVSLVNMCTQLQHIVEFHRSPHTPDESVELETMIDHLLDMRERLGEASTLLAW